MKSLFRLFLVLALALVSLRAADDKIRLASVGAADETQYLPAVGKIIAAVGAADKERVAATKAGDRARLDAIFSDSLRYAHSSGKVDTKASYIESLVTRKTVYESYDYKDTKIMPAAPGIVLMTGRVLIHSRSGETQTDLDLNFLAVWREENGQWRFLAWQSCKNPPSAPAAK